MQVAGRSAGGFFWQPVPTVLGAQLIVRDGGWVARVAGAGQEKPGAAEIIVFLGYPGYRFPQIRSCAAVHAVSGNAT